MIDVVCALILRQGRVLLAQRPAGKHLEHCWEFAGGKVDAGEMAEQSLHRELHEELGCKVHVIAQLSAVEHEYDRGKIRLIPFICELADSSPEPHAKEHQALAWVPWREIQPDSLAPADVPVLPEFQQWCAERGRATVLLAGGRSRRMGQEKAALRWQGQTLATHQLQTLHTLPVQHSLVSAREEQRYLFTPVVSSQDEFLPDPPAEDLGPLPAVLRSLKATGTPTLALAVDMPATPSSWLQTLLAQTVATVPRVEDSFEPLCALYTPALIPLLEEALASQQLSLQKLWVQAVEQGLAKVIQVKPEEVSFFENWNQPEDLPLTAEQGVTLKRLYPNAEAEEKTDSVAVEEPLEIRVEGRSVAVVMRTPGHDRELAAGFLVSEGVITKPRHILEISQCAKTTESQGNVVDVLLGSVSIHWDKLTRHVFSASSCGLCGKTSLNSVFQSFPPVEATWQIQAEQLWSMPEQLRAQQQTFSSTGGLHACALFDDQGQLRLLREDVGRHNALDKLLGHGALNDLLPYSDQVLLLSGRVSFEMMQKALAAGIPIVAAISAPTSLAVQFAKQSGQTLVGFLRSGSMNVYSGEQRIKMD